MINCWTIFVWLPRQNNHVNLGTKAWDIFIGLRKYGHFKIYDTLTYTQHTQKMNDHTGFCWTISCSYWETNLSTNQKLLRGQGCFAYGNLMKYQWISNTSIVDLSCVVTQKKLSIKTWKSLDHENEDKDMDYWHELAHKIVVLLCNYWENDTSWNL